MKKQQVKKRKSLCKCKEQAQRAGNDLERGEHYITCPLILTPAVLRKLGIYHTKKLEA